MLIKISAARLSAGGRPRKEGFSMKQLLRRFGVPFTMLIFCALLCVYIYRLPKAVREPLPVLMYHHLVEDGQDCNDMTVTPSKLRSDLETILALGYTPVLPRELAAGGPAAGKAHSHHL